MPVSKEKFKAFQDGFNKALGGMPEDDMTDEQKMKKKMEEEKASSILFKSKKASDILGKN